MVLRAYFFGECAMGKGLAAVAGGEEVRAAQRFRIIVPLRGPFVFVLRNAFGAFVPLRT